MDGQGFAIGIARRLSEPLTETEPELYMRSGEMPDIILIVTEIKIAIASLPHIVNEQVVGIIAESENTAFPSISLPYLAGVENCFKGIPNHTLVLLEAESGLVIAEPGPTEILLSQQRRGVLSPRKRLFLGDHHLSPTSLDGQTIHIGAVVSVEQANDGVSMGADLLYTDMPPFVNSPAEYLDQMISKANGKPLIIVTEAIEAQFQLLEACVQSEITIVYPIDAADDLHRAKQYFLELRKAHADCLEQGVPSRLPTFAVYWRSIGLDDTCASELVEMGACRVIHTVEYDTEPDYLGNLSSFYAVALQHSLAVCTQLSAFIEDENLLKESALNCAALGASTLLVNVDHVRSLKGWIAETSFSQVRSELLTLRVKE